MTDPTENARRLMVDAISGSPNEREALEEKYGKVWSAKEIREDFEIIGFFAAFVRVTEIATDKKGVLEFQHDPRYYFDFVADQQ